MSYPDGSPSSTPQKICPGEESDSDYDNENIRPRGLTGLQNLGNTCYLNSALQSLSNCPPLTRYFLDCANLIRPEKPPMLARSYLKLITELWHKKRPSYVVPSGVVTGIKAVHPMFRGYTQQDAQEFLRCLMDQLHEELKVPYSSDDSDIEDEEREPNDDGSNNAASPGDNATDSKIAQSLVRRPSFDSLSSQSELDYETCDSGLSSERSSTGGQDNGSSDENCSDGSEVLKGQQFERTLKSSATNSVVDNADSVANTKEKKETANLLEKKSESDGQNRRATKGRAVMEGGDSRDQGSSASCVIMSARDSEGSNSNIQPLVPSVTAPQQQAAAVKHSKQRKPKNVRYESIISQTFDGKILSSVRCLNCETVSTTKETFQDLSLPIPSKDHLHMLHSGHPLVGGMSPPKGGTCGEVHQGWVSWMFSWMKSWFTGPTITLQDCLSAFFSADELKGDNMYSCDKCNKLRNGLKYSKVLELPEILSIHLKRFRHEFYSSKINTYISFPLEGLDMEPYLHKACKNEVTLYDLIAIICHHGTAGGGHYTAYCLNHLNEQWYEFDDQYVTEVDVNQVQNCEAYVLFYRKSNKKMESLRQRMIELEKNEPSILRFYLSKQWESRFSTFAEPGPITNNDFLCKHGGVPPGKVLLIDDLVSEIHQSTWEMLYNRFGGGPVCNHLYACKTCQHDLDKLRLRQMTEKEQFIQLNEDFHAEEHSAAVYAISMAWFKEWESFVREKTDIPPGPIENNRITVYKNGQATVRQGSDYGQLSKDMWLFLHRIYGGGPELIIRQSLGAAVRPVSSSPTPQQQNQVVKVAASPVVPLQTSSSPSQCALSSSSATSAVAATSHMVQSSTHACEVVPVNSSSLTRASTSSTCIAPSSASVNSNEEGDVRRSCSEMIIDYVARDASVVDSSSAPTVVCRDLKNSGQQEAKLNKELPETVIREVQKHQQPVPDSDVAASSSRSESAIAQMITSLSPIARPTIHKSSSMSEVNASASPQISTCSSTRRESVSNFPSGRQQLDGVHGLAKNKTSPAKPLTSPLSSTSPTATQATTSPTRAVYNSSASGKYCNQASPLKSLSTSHLIAGGTPSPASGEDVRTSAESLLDSGVSTDYSCSCNDLTAQAGQFSHLGSSSIGDLSSLEDQNDKGDRIQSDCPATNDFEPVVVTVVSGKDETLPVTSKGKKYKKKGNKFMDMTRV